MDNLTNLKYSEMVDRISPKSKSLKKTFHAFLIGGAICMIGQGLIQFYTYLGIEKETAGLGASITLIFLSTLLTGLHIYDDIAKFGGAGTLVPITGFANAIASPAIEFKTEGYVLGIGAKLFSIAGPVIAYGLASGVLYGLFIYLFKFY